MGNVPGGMGGLPPGMGGKPPGKGGDKGKKKKRFGAWPAATSSSVSTRLNATTHTSAVRRHP